MKRRESIRFSAVGTSETCVHPDRAADSHLAASKVSWSVSAAPECLAREMMLNPPMCETGMHANQWSCDVEPSADVDATAEALKDAWV